MTAKQLHGVVDRAREQFCSADKQHGGKLCLMTTTAACRLRNLRPCLFDLVALRLRATLIKISLAMRKIWANGVQGLRHLYHRHRCQASLPMGSQRMNPLFVVCMSMLVQAL